MHTQQTHFGIVLSFRQTSLNMLTDAPSTISTGAGVVQKHKTSTPENLPWASGKCVYVTYTYDCMCASLKHTSSGENHIQIHGHKNMQTKTYSTSMKEPDGSTVRGPLGGQVVHNENPALLLVGPQFNIIGHHTIKTLSGRSPVRSVS